MFNETLTSLQSLKHNDLTVSPNKKKPTISAGIVSEKFAIITCSLIIGMFAIPILIVMQAVSAITWGTVTIWQLLDGNGLFQQGDEL